MPWGSSWLAAAAARRRPSNCWCGRHNGRTASSGRSPNRSSVERRGDGYRMERVRGEGQGRGLGSVRTLPSGFDLEGAVELAEIEHEPHGLARVAYGQPTSAVSG